MAKSTTDVFLVHSLNDRGVASLVTAAMNAAGLTVFDDRQQVSGGAKWQQATRRAMLQTKCVVMLLTANSVSSSNILFKAGMAYIAAKPIFVLHDGLPTEELPEFLQKFHVAELTQLADVVAEIQSLAGHRSSVATA